MEDKYCDGCGSELVTSIRRVRAGFDSRTGEPKTRYIKTVQCPYLINKPWGQWNVCHYYNQFESDDGKKYRQGSMGYGCD